MSKNLDKSGFQTLKTVLFWNVQISNSCLISRYFCLDFRHFCHKSSNLCPGWVVMCPDFRHLLYSISEFGHFFSLFGSLEEKCFKIFSIYSGLRHVVQTHLVSCFTSYFVLQAEKYNFENCNLVGFIFSLLHNIGSIFQALFIFSGIGLSGFLIVVSNP